MTPKAMTTEPTTEKPGRKPRHRVLIFGLQFSISFLLVLWLLYFTDLTRVLVILTDIEPSILFLAVLCSLFSHWIRCAVWKYSLLEKGRAIPMPCLMLSYWTSLFVGSVLPTEYGGDILRIRDMWSRLPRSLAVASVLWTRIAGLVATLIVFVVFGAAAFSRLRELSLVWLWAASIAGLAVLSPVIFAKSVSRGILEFLSSLPVPAAPRNWVVYVFTQMRDLATHPKYAWRILAVSLAGQVTMIFTNYLYAESLGQSVALTEIAFLIALLAIASLLPISLGGIGVKEGIFVFFLTLAGISKEGALSIALLNRSAAVLQAVIGAGLFPFRGRLFAIFERD